MLHSNQHHISLFFSNEHKKTAHKERRLLRIWKSYISFICGIIVIFDFTELDIKQLASDF